MELTPVIAAFSFGSPVTGVKECTFGHINGTFFVDTEKDRFVLQRINKNVFKKPWEIMANVVGVTDHIRAKLAASGGDVENGALHFVPAGDRYYYVDGAGEYWRAYRFIAGDCYQQCDSADLFCRVGRAFGHFQNQLADYDAATLFEVIPDFHNTVKRYEAFEAAVAADVCGRAKDCKAEIAFVRARREVCALIVKGLADGRFPLRVTHNDTKLNNVIMDQKTGEGLCVIDLDTVMPGSLLYDFGDAIRYGASSAAEDETDLSKVFIKPDLFAAFTEGYVQGTEGAMTRDETLALPESARVLTLETGIRFLTDHLSGDTYFRIHHAGHNLERARNQFKIVESIEQQRDALDGIVRKYL